MALDFQPRADGYRVCRMTNGAENMLASVKCRAMTGYDAKGDAAYVPLPRAEWTVHSAIGPLTVADLEDIIAGVPDEALPALAVRPEVRRGLQSQFVATGYSVD